MKHPSIYLKTRPGLKTSRHFNTCDDHYILIPRTLAINYDASGMR